MKKLLAAIATTMLVLAISSGSPSAYAQDPDEDPSCALQRQAKELACQEAQGCPRGAWKKARSTGRSS